MGGAGGGICTVCTTRETQIPVHRFWKSVTSRETIGYGLKKICKSENL